MAGDQLKEVGFVVLGLLVGLVDKLEVGEAVELAGEYFLERSRGIGDHLAHLKLPQVLFDSFAIYVLVVLDVSIKHDVLFDGVLFFYQVVFFSVFRGEQKSSKERFLSFENLTVF